MKSVILGIKGFIIGFFMMIPGLSGGSLAIMLGIYEELLMATANLRKKEHLFFIFLVVLGGGFGILAVSMLLSFIKGNKYFSFIVVGIVVATILPYVKKLKLQNILFFLLGIVIAIVLSFIPQIEINYMNFSSILFLIAIEFLLAIGLILPGISFSYLLTTFNLFDRIIEAIKTMDILFLLIFGLTLVFWIIITAKSLSYVFQKYPKRADAFILGFLVFSITGINMEFTAINIPLMILCFFVGFFVSTGIIYLSNKTKTV